MASARPGTIEMAKRAHEGREGRGGEAKTQGTVFSRAVSRAMIRASV
jgi:hypothetical protein